MTERDDRWKAPSALITAAVLISAVLLIPFSNFSDPPPVWTFGAGWLSIMLLLSAGWVLLLSLRLMHRRVHSPIGELIAMFRANTSLVATVCFGFLLTGLIQLGFNWVKPQIAILVPFWADPLLADADKAIFGTDPWLPLQQWLGRSIRFFDWVYSLWYPVTLIALFGTLVLGRARAIVAYFLLWGVFGTVVQALISAAGPVFWARIGLGDRFNGLLDAIPYGSKHSADYLWRAFETGSNDVAVGISAMPSMHVAMAAWIALTYIRTRAAILGVAYWLLVFVGSVALGWHYFIDGLVGTLGAVMCWMAAKFIVDKKPMQRPTASLETYTI